MPPAKRRMPCRTRLTEAADAASDAVDGAADLAEEGANAATEAAEGAADAVTDTAGEAAEAVDNALEEVGEAAEAAQGAAEEAAENAAQEAEEAAAAEAAGAEAAAADAAEDADARCNEATDAAERMLLKRLTLQKKQPVRQRIQPAEGAEEALTVENFSMEKVSEMIANSDIADVQKTVLEQSLKAAQDNPEALKAALDAVREALGL